MAAVLHTSKDISIHAAQEGCDIIGIVQADVIFVISIHAAQEGCDGEIVELDYPTKNFNPRSPRGLRLTE